MFDNLSERLSGMLDRLTRRGALSEGDVDEAMREVRRALLEADVALDVARAFVDQVRQRAVGIDVIKSVTPGQMVVKIVHDELVDTLGSDARPIDLNAAAPVPIMMVGLQGSGKTTTTAKIAKRLTERDNRKVLMASLDTRRPAAMEQLAVLGQQVNVETLPIVARPDAAADRGPRHPGGEARRLRRGAARHRRPHHARRRADERGGRGEARRQPARNPAGRRQPDRPGRGQSRARVRRALGLTGIVLTRVDGDGRGGAALSMRAVTGKPIKLIGVGERMDALEDFDPARIAGRILGMGDIVSLVEKAAANHRPRAGDARRREDAQGSVRPRRHARAACADAEDGRHDRADGHDARRRQDQEPDRRAQSRRQRAEAADGDHRLDDAGASASHPTSSRRAARSASPPAPAPRSRRSTSSSRCTASMADMMKIMGGGKAQGPMAGLAQHDGPRRRHAVAGRDGEARRADAGRHPRPARPRRAERAFRTAADDARPRAEISGPSRAWTKTAGTWRPAAELPRTWKEEMTSNSTLTVIPGRRLKRVYARLRRAMAPSPESSTGNVLATGFRIAPSRASGMTIS